MNANKHEGCIHCGKPLHGRIDKKFCNDQCRNSFNNSKSRESNNLVRNITAALRRNRKIINDLLANKTSCNVSRSLLVMMGFDFEYVTHSGATKDGKIVNYCYDYGYLVTTGSEIKLFKPKNK